MLKTYLLFFAGVTICSSCKHAVKNTTNSKSVLKSTTVIQKKDLLAYQNPLFNVFNLFLNKLDTNNIESSTVAAKKYVELFKNQDQYICDTAFLLFNNYYRKLSNTLGDLPSRDTSIKYDSLLTDSSGHHHELSKSLQLYAEKLKLNGFKVYMSEGDDYIGQDLDFVAKWFYGYVSPPMREYLVQLNKDDKEGFSEDAGLTISPIQLADRTVWWEKFYYKYSKSIIAVESRNNWKDYLETLLQGMDNSPVIDFDSNKLDDYYKAAYTYLQSNYPNSRTNAFVNPYFKLLLNKDTINAKKLLGKYQQDKVIE